VAAEHGTHVGDIDDQPVRVESGDQGRRGVILDNHGILDLRCIQSFPDAGNRLQPYRTFFVCGVYEAGIVRGDAPAVALTRLADLSHLPLSEPDYFTKSLHGFDAVFEMPLVLLPVFFCAAQDLQNSLLALCLLLFEFETSGNFVSSFQEACNKPFYFCRPGKGNFPVLRRYFHWVM